MLLAANNYFLLSLQFNLLCIAGWNVLRSCFVLLNISFCALITFSQRKDISLSVRVTEGELMLSDNELKNVGSNVFCSSVVQDFESTCQPLGISQSDSKFPSPLDPSLILDVCTPLVANNCFLTAAALGFFSVWVLD